MRRFPRSVYDVGREPDPRFSLANERTFLAWIRTSLALLAAGVALDAVPVLDSRLRLVTALLFVGLGLVGVGHSWIGWARTERALRENKALAGPQLGVVLAAGLVLAVVLIVVGLVL